MGRNSNLGELARTNESRCTEITQIHFGYNLQSNKCAANWYVILPGVVFEIEELALTNDLFETTMNWHALTGAIYRAGAGDENFEVSYAPYGA